MSWSTMADVPNPIIVDAAGTAGSGYVLKAYLPGTTTSTSIAIAAAGTSPQTSITANAEGKWEVSGNEILPYIDRIHKWGIFANSTDAAANTPFYMGPFDNVTPLAAPGVVTSEEATTATMTANTARTYVNGDVVQTAEFSTGNGGGGIYDVVLTSSVTPNTYNIIIGVADALISFKLRYDKTLFSKQWGCLGDGSTDDTAAIKNAVTNLVNWSTLYFEPGVYIVDGEAGNQDVGEVIHIDQLTGVNITGDSALIKSNLDMTTKSCTLVRMDGCIDSHVHGLSLEINATGTPVYATNTYENWAAAVWITEDDADQVPCERCTGYNLHVRVHHPEGASIGNGTGNPTHPTYAGKLVGISIYGGFDASTPRYCIGCSFYDIKLFECSARVVWLWTTEGSTLSDLQLINCGTGTTEGALMGIRCLHGNGKTTVSDITFVNGFFSSSALIFSDNGGVLHPNNLVINGINATNLTANTGIDFDGIDTVSCSNVNIEFAGNARGIYIEDGVNNIARKSMFTNIVLTTLEASSWDRDGISVVNDANIEFADIDVSNFFRGLFITAGGVSFTNANIYNNNSHGVSCDSSLTNLVFDGGRIYSNGAGGVLMHQLVAV